MDRALVVAALLACACSEPEEPGPEVPDIGYCEEVASWDPAHAAFEREVLELVNERRAEGGSCDGGDSALGPAPALRMDPALRCAARKHTLGMISRDEFDHEGPEGETYVERSTLAEYAGEPLAQSIAAGLREPAQAVATWMSHDGNCANLLDPDATELGVGYLPAEGVSYSHYWTLVFGRSQ